MDEPKPQYAWVGIPKFSYEMKYERGHTYFRWSSTCPWLSLNDSDMERFGFTRQETTESRLARAEWRIRQLELELERRQDRERETLERE